MTLTEAADLIAAELSRCGYLSSTNQTLQPWDRIFFAKARPAEKRERPCACGGVLSYHDGGSYFCGQWQCNQCTRLFGATVAETVGALRAMLEERERKEGS